MSEKQIDFDKSVNIIIEKLSEILASQPNSNIKSEMYQNKIIQAINELEMHGDDEQSDDIDGYDDNGIPDNKNGFIIYRDVLSTKTIKCPYCKKEEEIPLSRFLKSQYYDQTCSHCKKIYLVKLDFSEKFNTYVEKKNDK